MEHPHNSPEKLDLPPSSPPPSKREDENVPRRHVVRFSDDILIIPYEQYQDASQTTEAIEGEAQPLQRHRKLDAQHWRRRNKNDSIVLLLVTLCCIPICFMLGVVAWATNNPSDMCTKAPMLATFFNRLPAATIVVLPGLTIGLMMARPKERLGVEWERSLGIVGDDHRVETGWTRLQIVLSIVLVALGTLVFMPWVWEVRIWGYEVDCGLF